MRLTKISETDFNLPVSAPILISVIVTVYRRVDYLGEALDSALAQIYPNYEIIVADDSGTEAARAAVESRGRPDLIRYLPNATTLGVARSLARAVALARGDYIAVLNDDDSWEPAFLSELAAPLADDRRRVLAFGDHWIMDSQGRVDLKMSDAWSDNFGRLILGRGELKNPAEYTVIQHGVPIAQSAVFRKNAFDWNQITSEVAGAYDYWISCLLAATRRPIYYVPKRLARWRVHSGMETERRGVDKGSNLPIILERLLSNGWFPELDSMLKSALADALVAAGREKEFFGRQREARVCFWRAFVQSRRIHALVLILATCLPITLRRYLQSVRSLSNQTPDQSTGSDPFFNLRSSLKLSRRCRSGRG